MRLHRLHPAEGYDRLALETSERSRARGLLDLLAEARVDIREGVDPSLLERERMGEQQINAKEQYRFDWLEKEATKRKLLPWKRRSARSSRTMRRLAP